MLGVVMGSVRFCLEFGELASGWDMEESGGRYTLLDVLMSPEYRVP